MTYVTLPVHANTIILNISKYFTRLQICGACKHEQVCVQGALCQAELLSVDQTRCHACGLRMDDVAAT